jgi:hypothetical protein
MVREIHGVGQGLGAPAEVGETVSRTGTFRQGTAESAGQRSAFGDRAGDTLQALPHEPVLGQSGGL